MKNNRSFFLRQDMWYFLFWPVFLLRYVLVENQNPAIIYHPVHCVADDSIPFLEIFLIPYILWYFCIMGIHLWLYCRNDPVFRMYSRYLIITMSLSTMVFLLYPTCQELRPMMFPRRNLLTDAVGVLYRMDTNTNVCPSEHVIGSAGFLLAACYSRDCGVKLKFIAALSALMTAGATVFLKQHSLVDVLAAMPVSLIGWVLAFRIPVFNKSAEDDYFPGQDPMKGTSF